LNQQPHNSCVCNLEALNVDGFNESAIMSGANQQQNQQQSQQCHQMVFILFSNINFYYFLAESSTFCAANNGNK
jgi:hypothetical protein